MRPDVRILRRACARGSVVIGGHGVADVPAELDPENLCVPPARFRAQVELMLEAGYRFVTVSELAAAGDGGPPPPGLAALSFDDGMADNLYNVLPMLREYGLPATVYVATGLMGAANPFLDARARMRMMTPDELRELAAGGVEIGAHTVTHAALSRIDEERARAEAADSRAALEELLGGVVSSFAYPYCDAGGQAVTAVRAAGYTNAVVGARSGAWSPLEIPRAMMTGLNGTPSFVAKVAGFYEPIVASRAGLAARAITRRPRLLARRLRGNAA